MSSPKIKNISLFQKSKSGHIFGHPVPLRGASAVVTNAGRVAVDARVATDESSLSVRQSRVVLTPRWWCQVPGKPTLLGDDGGKKPVRRGEHDISRKAIAQGMPECSDCTCMLVCAFLCAHLHTRPRVQQAPGIPCSLCCWRDKVHANLGRIVPRERGVIFSS